MKLTTIVGGSCPQLFLASQHKFIMEVGCKLSLYPNSQLLLSFCSKQSISPFSSFLSWFMLKCEVKYMATSAIGLLQLLKLVMCIAVMILCALDSTKSIVIVNFHQAPPEQSRISTAVFQYSTEFPDGSNACKNNSCHMSCEVTFLLKHLSFFLLNLNR